MMKLSRINKVRHSDAQTVMVQKMVWSKKIQASSLAAVATILICTSIPTYAADLEIYKVPEDSVGTTTLMMMLDLSGSMGYGVGYNDTSMSIQEDYNVCVGSRTNVQADTTTTSYYTRYYCGVAANTTNQKVTGYWYPSVTDPERKWVAGCEAQKNATGTVTGYRCYDRLTRLKDGLRQVLEGTATVPRVDDRIIMGLASFAGSNGFVRVPARPLDEVIRSYKVMETYWDTEQYQELVQIGTKSETYTFARPLWITYKQTTPAKTCSWWDWFCTPVAASTKTYYQTCTAYNNSDPSICRTWGNPTTSEPAGFNTSLSNTCTQGDSGTCREIYKNEDGTRQVPITELQTKTRPVQKQREVTKNVTQRDLLLETIKDLQANGGTPTPYAYAEAAAYLLGTNTNVNNYNIQFFQTLGNRRTNRTDNYPCDSGNSATNDYRQYQKPDGSPITIRWCNSTNRSWNPPSSATSLIYGRDGGGYDRELFYNLNNPLSVTTGGGADYSGWSSSVSDAKTGSNYTAPVSITSQKTNTAKRECSGQGIYFLTDGQPQPGGWAVGDDGKSGTAYALMKQALGTNGSEFSCSASPLGKRAGYDRPENGWACVGKLAQTLLDPTKNPAGVRIQTAVVGFGSSFGAGGEETNDVRDAKDWGVVGNGGWFAGSSPEDVSNSINKFIKDLNKDIPSMSTGSSTVPMDALNPEIIQPYAYFPQFEPKVNPVEKQQLWFGNLKKYYVYNNGVYSNAKGGAANTVVKQSKLQDLSDIWALSGVTYTENTPIYKKGGALSRLLLGVRASTNSTGGTEIVSGRKLLTEYVYDGTKTVPLSRNFDLTRISHTYTTDAKTKTDEASKVRGLMSLLGYNISSDTDTNGLNVASLEPTLRQMGSVYHSLPVLLTQEGKAEATRNAVSGQVEISSTGRQDYVMFGTTQGLLSVVDALTGEEKFAFVPKEMIERQSETFKENAGTLAGGKNALYYGIDGEWAAHTVYVTKSDGTLTVKGTVRNIVGGTQEDKENLQGKQWVYGGMRMGGRSYYALDLTDINNPKLKFHIDPNTGKVYSSKNPEGKTFAGISTMGQSWSKPKLDYINWKGQRKLVMFVGGGYDAGGPEGDGTWSNGIRTGYAGYEFYNYKQENKIGAGVYMFDADTGDLLWNATSTNNADLKYSVVSDIKTVDRNNDGIVDHIYFGDLAGQAFRTDFRNNGADSFVAQTTKILYVHQSDGTSPRFYLPPVFTAHYSAGKKEGANVVVASFISGNKSSPLLATSDSPITTGKRDPLGLQYDAVYAIYDYDIQADGSFYPNTLSNAKTLAATNTLIASPGQLKYISDDSTVRNTVDNTLIKGAVADPVKGWGGWYYRFDKKFSATGTNRADAGASIIKGLTPLIAMEGSLYVSMYDASNNGTSSSCGAGVKGHTFVQRLCLPTGVCADDAKYSYNLGSGIVIPNVGSTYGGGTKSLVVPDPEDIGDGCVGAACQSGQKFIPAGGSIRFIANRWYERYAKAVD